MLENTQSSVAPESSSRWAESPQTTLVSCARRLWGGPKSAELIEDRRLRALARTIEENPDNWASIRRGIHETHLSQAYLSVRFKEAAGLPMRSFALWMKFEQACALVVSGTSPGDAAIEAGFADQSHMGRAARRFAKKSFRRAINELRDAMKASTENDRLHVAPVASVPLDGAMKIPFRVAS